MTMKLYVVNETDPDPDTWGYVYDLVLAETPEEARALAGYTRPVPVTEIPMDKPGLVVSVSTDSSDE